MNEYVYIVSLVECPGGCATIAVWPSLPSAEAHAREVAADPSQTFGWDLVQVVQWTVGVPDASKTKLILAVGGVEA